jgi:hypothetical protein
LEWPGTASAKNRTGEMLDPWGQKLLKGAKAQGLTDPEHKGLIDAFHEDLGWTGDWKLHTERLRKLKGNIERAGPKGVPGVIPPDQIDIEEMTRKFNERAQKDAEPSFGQDWAADINAAGDRAQADRKKDYVDWYNENYGKEHSFKDFDELNAARKSQGMPEVSSEELHKAPGYFRAVDDRGALDRAALNRGSEMTHKVHGTGSLDVNVNAPAGTQVRAKSGGIFRQLNLNRQTQMGLARGGPAAPAEGIQDQQ